MPLELMVARIDDGLRRIQFSQLDFEHRLQNLLDEDISLVSPVWMVIGREVLTSTGGEIDILCINPTGDLVILELKRDKTPRDVVAQVLDYGSWVRGLKSDEIAEIYSRYLKKYHPDRAGTSLDDAFRARFKVKDLPDELNQAHELVIVASRLDSATERIVNYLATYDVAINAVFFQVFKDDAREYLTRAWLNDPTAEPGEESPVSQELVWNGEYYVSFSDNSDRRWDDASRYGFISAGGGEWYTKTLEMLKPDNRIWVNVPGKGFVGVGIVTTPVVPAADFTVVQQDGTLKPLADLSLASKNLLNPTLEERVVGVRWLKVVNSEKAIHEKGFFGNQNTVARPKSRRWDHTISRLRSRFGITDFP